MADSTDTYKHSCMQLFDLKDDTFRNSGLPPTNLIAPQNDPEALTIEKGWIWPNGKTLKVRFLSHPSDLVIEKVKQYASIWEQYANLKFQWVDSGPADIRIAFNRAENGGKGGSWSYVGRHATSVTDENAPTMNFGWFDDETDDGEFQRTTCHEFGHAIGAQHEQVNPNWPFTWNKQAVYDYFAQPPNEWPQEKVDINFNNFEPMPRQLVEATEWDGTSIMQYWIRPSFTVEGREIAGGTELSPYDKTFIARIYPRSQAPPAADFVQVFVENRMSGARKNMKVAIDGRQKPIAAYLGNGVTANAVGVNGTAANNVEITLSGNGQSYKLSNNGSPAVIASGQPIDISQWNIAGKKTI